MSLHWETSRNDRSGISSHKESGGIICGHMNTPEDKRVGSIHHLNSGDWVENLTAR